MENAKSNIYWKNCNFEKSPSVKSSFLTYLTNVPHIIVDKLEEVQKQFLWGAKKPKIQHKTLIGSYENGGLKSVDIKTKIYALQLSLVKRLFDKNDHAWKLIPKHLLKMYYGSDEIFFPNTNLQISTILPVFYQSLISNWCKLALNEPLTAECVYTQRIWHNHFIKVDNDTLFDNRLAKMGVNFIKDLYTENGALKTWQQFKNELNCTENMYFLWRQIIASIPGPWKRMIHEDHGKSIKKGIHDIFASNS